MITMKDVAKDSGISRNSVSKVLNGDPTVKESTRKKVLASCEKLGYVRNEHAVNLVRRESRTIGLVVSRITDPFYDELIEAAEKHATKAGYQLIYKCSYMQADREEEILRHFQSLNVCALIIAPAFFEENVWYLERLEKQMPVVYMDKHFKDNCHYVMSDHLASVRQITEHLIAQGAEPAYIGKDCPPLSSHRAGYEAAMRAHGLACSYVPIEGPDPDNDMLYCYQNTARYLDANPMPTGLFCVSDAGALGAMRAVVEHGGTPGKDVLVAGHDDLRFSAFVQPGLTTMAQPKQEIGRTCVDVAIGLLKKKGKRTRYVQKVLQSELIVRESTSSPAWGKHKGGGR